MGCQIAFIAKEDNKNTELIYMCVAVIMLDEH
jgi:hypothetical protein